MNIVDLGIEHWGIVNIVDLGVVEQGICEQFYFRVHYFTNVS